MSNMATLLKRNARYRPDHTAVVVGETRLNYAQYNESVCRLANALAGMGIGKGDKVAILLPNRLEIMETYWALCKLGAVSVPLSTLLLSGGLKSLLNDSDSVAVITYGGFWDKLAPILGELDRIDASRVLLVDSPARDGGRDYHALKSEASPAEPPAPGIEPEHPFNIIYTSGTTGEPKGIVHSHMVRANYASMFANAFRMTPESVLLHTGSLVFNGAMVTFMPSMFLGATYILHAQFDAEAFIDTVEREKVTHVIMVPSQLIAILNTPGFSPKRLASLQMICSVGAPLHQEYKDLLTKVLPDCFYELYGLTEGVVTILDKSDFLRKSGSVGSPMTFYELKIVGDHGEELTAGEIGEIVGRGPLLMSGYYKRPDLTAQAMKNGWMHTGDLGYLDEDGYLYLVDRKKDMIISGGVNVYPRDIEEIVMNHPDVMECAVFGLPSDKWGETPVAAIIAKPGRTPDQEAIKAWVNQNVGAKYQRVSQVVLMSEFPRSAAGKTLKRVMRDDMSKA